VAVRANVSFTTEPGDFEPGPPRALPRAGRPEQRSTSPGRVLVLNASYEPINVCTVRRAAILILKNRAEVLEKGDWALHAESLTLPRPVVIRLLTYVRIPRDAHRRKITRRAVFARDRWTCQYCGHERGNLTVDHVVPRSKGGPHCWENLVSACKACNHRKGGKSLGEARMTLRKAPAEPRAGMYYTIERRLDAAVEDAWQKFLPGFQPVGRAPSLAHGLSRSPT
jgi:5-methylcytosine-specific restriction endonuclease McrA